MRSKTEIAHSRLTSSACANDRVSIACWLGKLSLGGKAVPVQSHQGAVEFRAPVAEQAPGGALRTDRIEIEGRGDDGPFAVAGFGELGAGRIGDERRTVEGDAGALALLAANAVRGRREASGWRRHGPAWCAASDPSTGWSGPAARCRLPSDRTGSPRPSPPWPARIRGTTGPNRCRRRACRSGFARRGNRYRPD